MKTLKHLSCLTLILMACEGSGPGTPDRPEVDRFDRDVQPVSPVPFEPMPTQERVALTPPLNSFEAIGDRTLARIEDGIAITEGVVRVRRRHENDMDFSKWNPFYWEGRIARFKVEDYTPQGESKITFTFFTEWPQDFTPTRGPDFSAIYTGNPAASTENLRSKFAINQRMNHIADMRKFEATLDGNAFRAHPQELSKGSLLTFEFRFFQNESFGPWARQKALNPHSLSAYYTEFFRIRIGEPGVYIDPGLGEALRLPDPQRYAGGWTTIPTVRVEPWKALQQQAFNLTFTNEQTFLDGRTWFHTDMISGQHMGDDTDDKPHVFFEEMRRERSGYAASAYNVRSCSSCHVNNGIAMLPSETAVNQAIHQLIVKTTLAETGEPHPILGQQLQTDGREGEGLLTLPSWETRPVTLDDGTVITLRKPRFRVQSSLTDGTRLGLSPRKPQALIGLGLLEAVSDDTLRELDAHSIGELRRVGDRIGRFGWKASHPTLKDQITAALNFDMGVRTAELPSLDCTPRCQPGKGILPQKAVEEMETYVSLLGVPPRGRPSDPNVLRGAKIFEQLNCQSCHVPTLRTGDSRFAELKNQTIQAYTDLLLHDLGEGLADDSGTPWARKWRTAPLWGLKNVKHATRSHTQLYPAGQQTVVYTQTQKTADSNPIQLLHDGRAQTLAEAILWHGGTAEDSVRRYKALNREEREALEAFLWDL